MVKKDQKDLKLPEDVHYLLKIESAKRRMNMGETVRALIKENQGRAG